MNRHFVDILSRLHDALGKGGVGMNHVAELLRGCAHRDCEGSLMDEVRGMSAAQVHSQHFVRCLIGNDLHHTGDFAHGVRFAEAPVGNSSNPILDSLFLCLLFPKAHAADFRHREDAAGTAL